MGSSRHLTSVNDPLAPGQPAKMSVESSIDLDEGCAGPVIEQHSILNEACQLINIDEKPNGECAPKQLDSEVKELLCNSNLDLDDVSNASPHLLPNCITSLICSDIDVEIAKICGNMSEIETKNVIGLKSERGLSLNESEDKTNSCFEKLPSVNVRFQAEDGLANSMDFGEGFRKIIVEQHSNLDNGFEFKFGGESGVEHVSKEKDGLIYSGADTETCKNGRIGSDGENEYLYKNTLVGENNNSTRNGPNGGCEVSSKNGLEEDCQDMMDKNGLEEDSQDMMHQKSKRELCIEESINRTTSCPLEADGFSSDKVEISLSSCELPLELQHMACLLEEKSDYSECSEMPTAGSSNLQQNEQKDNRRIGGTSEKVTEVVAENVGGLAEVKVASKRSTRRSSRKSKVSTKTHEKKAPRKSKKAVKRKTRSDKLFEIFIKAVRKKRSLVCKRAHSSNWGLLEKIAIFFKQNNGPDIDVGMNQKKKNCVSKRSRGSKARASTNRIRLKIKMGKKEVLPDKVETLVPVHVKSVDYGTKSCGEISSEFSKLPKGNKFSEEAEDMRGRFDKRYHDPETSPDSEVINLIPDTTPLSFDNLVSHRDDSRLNEKCNDEAALLDEARPREKLGNEICSFESFASLSVQNDLRIRPRNEESPGEMFPSSTVTVTGLSQEAHFCGELEVGLGPSKSRKPKKAPPSTKTKGRKLPKSSKSNGLSKCKSKLSTEKRSQGNALRKKEKQVKYINKGKKNEKCIIDDAGCKLDNDLEKGNDITVDTEKSTNEQNLRPRNAWVSCDDCHKWRCISAALADIIEETNCKWTCKDNNDKAFADCPIPQEKSNAEINAELEISDASCDEDTYGAHTKSVGFARNHSSEPQKSSWMCIDSNLFLHRSRKSQTIDEIMVCHCKQTQDGRLGCGDACLNRMLNIECVQGTCPCGERCSNQQFQKRNYAKLKWFKCGKKGYGLQLLEDISQGRFLIEYVGEVLDLHAYEARQKEYALRGHKHFYFMTLNGSEIIDACAKGNLGRFINHSCDPNCRTEKWMVNGEVCIGLFAIRDIKKGEELTFDYNYVRVFGAAAKKCFCGSSQCRGYIGGDPLTSEGIVQCDSDEEYPEPVMVNEDGMITNNAVDDIISMPTSLDNTELENSEGLNDSEKLDKETQADIGKVKIPGEDESSVEIETENPSVKENFIRNDSVQSLETSLVNTKPETILSESVDTNQKSKCDTSESKRVFIKSRFILKPSRSSVKKWKSSSSNPVIANKSQLFSGKPKKVVEGAANGRFEAVEEKLNELLDSNGGISKRKDAAKGYLKLLLLTAASGDSCSGEAIQSTRDLSMILDALLKTKSRVVLVDIINKNGLRMLHNIMKQNRRNFNKIPILRKLLKVFTYLAAREILTREHINGGPPCPGMESLRESILSLTEHVDKQVHQSARSFRDKWIPRPVRKINSMDNSTCNRFSSSHKRRRDQIGRFTEAVPSKKQAIIATPPADVSTQQTVTNPINGTKPRKRKSRWDQPAETKEEVRKIDKDDVPPGFSSSINTPRYPSMDVSHGHPKEKFNSHLPVSYGIPFLTVQQYGTPTLDRIQDSWIIAPGIPFHPFPPLPPFPREMTKEEIQWNPPPITPGSVAADVEQGSTNENVSKRHRVLNNGLGRKYFRQQKWNGQQKCGPPWLWRRNNNWGFNGNAENNSKGMDNLHQNPQ